MCDFSHRSVNYESAVSPLTWLCVHVSVCMRGRVSNSLWSNLWRLPLIGLKVLFQAGGGGALHPPEAPRLLLACVCLWWMTTVKENVRTHTHTQYNEASTLKCFSGVALHYSVVPNPGLFFFFRNYKNVDWQLIMNETVSTKHKKVHTTAAAAATVHIWLIPTTHRHKHILLPIHGVYCYPSTCWGF